MLKTKTFKLEEGINKITDLVNNLLKTKQVIIIGITGSSCSGKSAVSNLILRKVGGGILPMDDYYLGIENMTDKNFDVPDSIDLKLLSEHITILKQNQKIKKPVYNVATHQRIGYEEYLPSKVIVIEGLFVFGGSLREHIDLKVFVEASEEIRLKRRIERDMAERDRTKESVIEQWDNTVQPM